MTDLHDLLDLATDRVEATGLAPVALTTARRRRRTRRAVLASAAAVVVVAGVAVAGRLVDDPSAQPEPAGPTRTVEPDLPSFDPRRVDDLPAAPAGLMPVLPAELDVPTSTPELSADPVEAAVLTVGRTDAVKVLGVDGVWRHVDPPVPGGSVELTRDGTRLLVQTADGVDLWDVATGERTSLPQPPGPTGKVGWRWRDDGALVVFDLGRAWTVDEATGEVGRQVDRESLWDVVNGDATVKVGRPAGEDSLAVTVVRGGDMGDRLLVRDDNRATYSNGGLSVQTLLDDGTVLLRVLVDPGPRASVRLVAWDPRTGDLSLVMRTSEVLPSWSVATELLG
ncbi:hypothetical protein GCM10027062_08280 [Nocardioides hungaricus]